MTPFSCLMPAFCMLLAISDPVAASARTCADFYYFMKGRSLDATVLDEKGRVKSRKLITVTEVSGPPTALRSMISTETYSSQDKLQETAASQARCENGDLLLDLTAGLPVQGDAPQGRETTASRAPALLRYPATMRVGQPLGAQVDFDLDGKAEGKAMKVGFTLADRRVAGEAEIETPLGRRQSFVISSVLNVRFKMVGLTIPMRYDLTEYFVPGFGVVRSEAWQKGKLVEQSTVRFRLSPFEARAGR